MWRYALISASCRFASSATQEFPSVKCPEDVRAERVKTFVAPIVPAITMGLSLANIWIWVAHWLRDRPNLEQISIILVIKILLLMLAAWYIRRVTRAGRVEATGICLIGIAALTSVTTCLITFYNGNGVVQSMPLCIIVPLLALIFWPRPWHFVAGTLVSVIPPVIQLFLTNHSVDERFMFGQLAVATVVVAVVLYALVHRTNQSIARMSAEIKYRAAYDGLTGLHNRAHWFEQSAKTYQACQRIGQPASLLFLDVDRFKQHNDRAGHVDGDRVLREAATKLAELTTGDHIPGRFGGDEFIIFLPNTEQAEADRLAARIKQAIACIQTTDGVLGVSVGACEALPGEELDQFISRTDRAMFAAKSAARSARPRAISSPVPTTS
jgi:diguanylate cyclase (GGDEF)-like protein